MYEDKELLGNHTPSVNTKGIIFLEGEQINKNMKIKGKI